MSARRLVLALAALLALPLAAARAEDPPPAAPPAPAPAGPTEAECKECIRVVDELREEAARIRGLAWKTHVPADLVTPAQMRADFVGGLAEEYPPAKRERDVAILRRLGLLTATQDPVALLLDAMEAGVAGYYDPKKKHLRIVQGYVLEAQRPIIVHELTHALEDQYIDLEGRTKPFEDDGDRTFAEKCLGEGSAEHARALYEAAHPDVAAAFQRAQMDPVKMMAQLEALGKTPAFLVIPTLMHYQKGPEFVGRAVKGSTYPERMAALYKDGPVSQEQVLHPDKWFGAQRDYPQVVVWGGDLTATAGEGWSLLYQMPSGELDLGLYLDFFLSGFRGTLNAQNLANTPNAESRKAAAGWDAGWTAYLKKDGQPLVMVDAWAFDTPQDASEAAQALAKAAEGAAGAAWSSPGWVEQAATDGAPGVSTLVYKNQHGTSRMRLVGTHILRVDGAAPEVLERLWPVVLGTSFVRDARDTWQPSMEKDPYETAGFKHDEQGVGLTVPGAAWIAAKAEGMPMALATVTHAEAKVGLTLISIPQAMTADELLGLLGPQLKAQFPGYTGEKAGTAKVGGDEGTRLVMGKSAQGGYGELVVAPGSGRVWVVRIEGPDAAGVDAVRADVVKILASVVVRKD